ncbi:MAG: aminoglycoside phosphotransferase family protein [Chloroflexota bacterium]|nr:aminoglycoside phosphotransferase family protein [Chloroflexota bacterium]
MVLRPNDRRNLRRQARILRLVHARPSLTSLSRLVPLPLLTGVESEWAFLVESRLPGRRPAPVVAGTGRTLRDALSTIALLHGGTACPATVDETLLRRWVAARVGIVSALLGGDDSDVASAEALVRLESELRGRLAGCSVRIGWIHGDYWPGNVLVAEDGSILGVVDWDSLQSRELPLHDSLHYVVTERRLEAGEPWGRAVGRMLSASSTEAEESALAEMRLTAPGIDRRTALLLYWLRGVEANWRRHPAVTAQPAWLRANVRPVLEALV